MFLQVLHKGPKWVWICLVYRPQPVIQEVIVGIHEVRRCYWRWQHAEWFGLHWDVLWAQYGHYVWKGKRSPFVTSLPTKAIDSQSSLQPTLSKADTLGTKATVRFREVSTLERVQLQRYKCNSAGSGPNLLSGLESVRLERVDCISNSVDLKSPSLLKSSWLSFVYPFHSWEWSISNFSCSLTRNMTSHSMENLSFHSLLRWNVIILQILATSLIQSLFERLGEYTFWAQEWKG